MESYLMMLYVTLEQESALKNFFVYKGWTFSKPDLSVTTDRLGPSVKDVQTEHVLPESRKSPRQSLKRKALLKQQKVPVSKLAKISSSPSSTRSSEHNYSNMTEDTENVEQQVTLKETEFQNVGDSKDGSSELNTSTQDEPTVKVEQFDITYNEDYDDGDDDNDEDTDVDYSFADAKEQNETENNEKSADNVDKDKTDKHGVKAEPSQPIEPKFITDNFDYVWTSEDLGYQSSRIATCMQDQPTEQSCEGPVILGLTRSFVPGSGIRRTLNVQTYETKYKAILAVEKGIKKKNIAEMIGVPANTLSTWLKMKEEIKKKYLEDEIGRQRKRDKKAKFPDVEQALLQWFSKARSQNIPISCDILRERAKLYAKQLHIKDFECSTGWLYRFKERHGLMFRKVCSDSNAVNLNLERQVTS